MLVVEEDLQGESGTGPGGDLVSATRVAVEMVGSLGLGGSLVSLRAADNGAFGGDLIAQVLRDNRARDAIEKLLHDQKAIVTRLLTENRHIIEALRDALLEREELVDREITEVIEKAQQDADLMIDLREPVG